MGRFLYMATVVAVVAENSAGGDVNVVHTFKRFYGIDRRVEKRPRALVLV